MNIDDRIRKLLNFIDLSTEDLARKTDTKYGRWTTIRKTGGRARAEEVEILCKLYPQFQMWIATGETLPEAGQVSPELEQIVENYEETGMDTQ
ncbi:hypothetical protein [Aliamphritea spongicola]|uniref:hypothetical protein n=1 Tax=Aliamphritea spongicola TaxID=707589 RepID=UPI00196B9812|nr:hypothetical protein [Aliamphritea spongicola]MBN3562509.1 hypothetical protein [Aliamphritea spongicola]